MKYDKLKQKARQIRLSDEQKERIIRNCEAFAAGNDTKDNTEFRSHVYGVERIEKNRQNIVRIISSMAACAVIVCAVSVTAHLAKMRGGEDMPGQSSMVQFPTSPQVTTSAGSSDKLPMGDLSMLDYTISCPGTEDRIVKTLKLIDGNTINVRVGDPLTQAQRDALADYFDSIKYEPVAESYVDNPASSRSSCYSFAYLGVNEYRTISFFSDGRMRCTYITYETDADGNAVATSISTQNDFKIDYDDMMSAIEKVLAMDNSELNNAETTTAVQTDTAATAAETSVSVPEIYAHDTTVTSTEVPAVQLTTAAPPVNNTGYSDYYSDTLKYELISDIRNGYYDFCCQDFWSVAVNGIRFPDSDIYEDYTYKGVSDLPAEDWNKIADYLSNIDYSSAQSRSDGTMSNYATLAYADGSGKYRSIQFSNDGWVRFREYECSVSYPGTREPEYIIMYEVKSEDFRIDGYRELLTEIGTQYCYAHGIVMD